MATALLLSSPDLPIGAAFNTRPPLVLRHAPPFKSSYHWNLRAAGIIEDIAMGCAPEVSHSVTMIQGHDGLHWFVKGSVPQLDICCSTERRAVNTAIRKWGLVFEAHPQIHQFPWSVPDVTPNRSVTKAFGAQAFRHCKNLFADPLLKIVAQLDTKAAKNEWQRAALKQTSRQVWSHDNGISEYQVWTGYRVALGQLNLYHDGRTEDKSCRKNSACRGRDETIKHLFWVCPWAVALWTKLVTHWTGERESRQRTQQFLEAYASRQVQDIPKHRAEIVKERFQDDVGEAERVWKQIWHILATICQTKLWTDRNEAVYRAASVDIRGSTNRYWTTCICHLRAIAKREHRKVATATSGAMLYACIELLEREPTGVPVFTGPVTVSPRITLRRSRHGLRYTIDLAHRYYNHGIDNLNHHHH